MIRERDHKENLLRGVKLFETMGDEQIAKLAGAMHRHHYEDGDELIHQGDAANDFYILESGEAVAAIKTGASEQVVKHYAAGSLFGLRRLARRTASPRWR